MHFWISLENYTAYHNADGINKKMKQWRAEMIVWKKVRSTSRLRIFLYSSLAVCLSDVNHGSKSICYFLSCTLQLLLFSAVRLFFSRQTRFKIKISSFTKLSLTSLLVRPKLSSAVQTCENKVGETLQKKKSVKEWKTPSERCKATVTSEVSLSCSLW